LKNKILKQKEVKITHNGYNIVCFKYYLYGSRHIFKPTHHIWEKIKNIRKTKVLYKRIKILIHLYYLKKFYRKTFSMRGEKNDRMNEN